MKKYSSAELSDIKAELLSIGAVKVIGKTPQKYKQSKAGPSADKDSIFFSDTVTRVRLTIDENAEAQIINSGSSAELIYKDTICLGKIEKAPCHCPNQAYITITEGCLHSCRYCTVPVHAPRRKSADEIISLIEESAEITDIDCISLTSGVMESDEEEAKYLYNLLPKLKKFSLPIGVSVCPIQNMVCELKKLGVSDVKFNLEAASEELFKEMCPGLDRDLIFKSLIESVSVFGKNHVQTNIILGLGETDEEMKACIHKCTSNGIIPIIRPLTPSSKLSSYSRPSAERIKDIAEYVRSELEAYGLDISKSDAMCAKCRGCDCT